MHTPSLRVFSPHPISLPLNFALTTPHRPPPPFLPFPLRAVSGVSVASFSSYPDEEEVTLPPLTPLTGPSFPTHQLAQ